MGIVHRLRLLPLLVLTAVWLMLWGKITAFLVFAGLVVAAFVLAAFPLPAIATAIRIRPLALLKLILWFLRELTIATLTVAWAAVRPSGISSGGIVRVRLNEQDDLVRTVIAEMTTLIPGTMVIDMNPLTSVLTVHVLGAQSHEQMEAGVDSILELERLAQAALGGRQDQPTVSHRKGKREVGPWQF